MQRPSLVLSVLLPLVSFSAAWAQVPTAFFMEGDSLPGGPAGNTVGSISNTAVNHNGGYAATVNTSEGGNTISNAWGNSSGGGGNVLFREGTVGQYEQTSWESFFGLSNSGLVAYSPSCVDTLSGTTGLDAVYTNSTKVMIEEEPYPNQAGWYWTFGSRPGVTSAGAPYFVGGITDIQGSSTRNRGLFYDYATTPLLIGGGSVAGLPDTLSHTSTVSFDYRFSAAGTHYIAEVATVTGSSTNDNHMVIDGAVILAGGSRVSEAALIPAAAGGLSGESWDNFDFAGITETGHWMFTGDTDAATSVDEIVVMDGEIRYREGDVLNGETLSGSIEGAYLNEDGDVAFIWDIQGNALEALFFNGSLLLTEGDEVDITGDMVPDAGVVVENFTGISALTLSDRNVNDTVKVYFTADVTVPASLVTPGFALSEEPDGIEPGDREAAGLNAEDSPERWKNREATGRANLEGFFVIALAPEATGVEAVATAVRIPGLMSVYPNPALGGGVQVRFAAPGDRPVTIDVYDIAGRQVRSLVAGRFPTGERLITWDGMDGRGRRAAPGTYFLRYSSGDRADTKRVMLIR